MIQQLEKLNYKITRIVNYWTGNILSTFFTEFVVDTFVSYTEGERRFFKGPQGTFLRSLNLWIKMLLCEKGTL